MRGSNDIKNNTSQIDCLVTGHRLLSSAATQGLLVKKLIYYHNFWYTRPSDGVTIILLYFEVRCRSENEVLRVHTNFK